MMEASGSDLSTDEKSASEHTEPSVMDIPEQKEIQKPPDDKTENSSDNVEERDPTNNSSGHTGGQDSVGGDVSLFKAPMSFAPSRMIVKKKTGIAAQAFDEKSDLKSVKQSGEVASDSQPETKTVEYCTPTQQAKVQDIPIPYKEPIWGGLCTEDYSFEVIKNGTVVDTLDLKPKPFYVFGRLPSCDVTMEHPSLSRYHAIVQYCSVADDRHPIGWYLYDLDSTHGTWVNKTKIQPRVYIRLRVGYVLKFGGSSRLNILQGPPDDQDEEAELSVTEMKEQREKQKKEAELLRQAELMEAENQKLLQEKAQGDTGCSWGMSTDAEEILAENPFALMPEPENEDLYIEDPKKALRGYFEREGLDLPEYDLVEEGRGKYKCRVELPIDGPNGEPIFAETILSGKKREVVASCALEACKILDRHGELRKATHESRARKRKNWEENDYYDSDEDTFLDRTGDIEKKRKSRMHRGGKKADKSETYESLVQKLAEVDKKMTAIENQIQESKDKAASLEDDGLDVFDAYMLSLKSGALDTKSKMKLKRELFDLRQEKMKLEKLANLAKPALPTVVTKSMTPGRTGVMFGKIRGPVKGAGKPPKPVQKPMRPEEEENIVEEEDDDEEIDQGLKKKKVPTATLR